jgi:hypothetical protein
MVIDGLNVQARSELSIGVDMKRAAHFSGTGALLIDTINPARKTDWCTSQVDSLKFTVVVMGCGICCA